jgi:type VI secretion system protein ImpG
MDERQEFLPYYLDELAYLRRMGREFARLYPKIAARLELADGHTSDPHVERLIESFAFLTGKLQRRLSLEFPEITSALLGVLQPNLVNPVPPLAVARFEADPAQGKLTSGRLIPRHTRLFAQTREGTVCRFRTCYPVELWPLSITEVGLYPRSAFSLLDHLPRVGSVLRVRLEAKGVGFGELDIARLRFHLHGAATVTSALYDLLFESLDGVALVPEREADTVHLSDTAVSAVGFGPDDEVIPAPSHAHAGYRLLQEYLQFPAKFHFFDLLELGRHRADRRLDLLFLFRHAAPSRLVLDADTLQLGCTPIANLFPRTTEPIRIDYRTTEYRLVGDVRREATTEIQSIQSVSASADPAKPTDVVEPFFSFRHASSHRPQTAFWQARRAPTGRADLPGTDMWLSFVDLAFKPSSPPSQVVYAHTLCTNRELAVQLPMGVPLHLEEAAPVTRIVCLARPTDTAYPAFGGATFWQLISSLSLNHLSLGNGPESLQAVRELLRLYDATKDPAIQRQIEGIREMTTAPVVGRLGVDAWRGFCRGTEVTLVFDDTQYVGASAYLFASVLHHFFAMHASVNSFTQVVMRRLQREQESTRFPPLAGYQPVI